MAKISICEMIDQPTLGGGQAVLFSLADHLNRDLFDTAVASAPGGPLAERAREKGLKHIAVPLDKKIGLRTVGRIASILRENKFDILHTHGGYAGLYGRLAARRAGTPVVVHTLHGIHYLHCRNPVLRQLLISLERFCSRLSDGLILVSYSDLGRALRHRLAAEDKMSVILNGIPTPEKISAEANENKRLELGLEADRPVVGTVARLHRQKGVVWLVRAGAIICHRFPQVRIVVVGGGPEEKGLRRIARKLGLEKKILFLGARADAAAIMALFDVFVLPSLWEGLPLVLIEAAAQGKPIVATAVDGTKEIIDDGKTGILVPPKSPQALSEAVLRLLEDPDRASRMAERARAVIPERFPLRRMVEQTQNLYLKLYAKKKQAEGPV